MTNDTPTHSPFYARLPFFYGWVVVAISFITLGIGTNTRTTFSLLFPPILAEFGWDRGQTAGAFSVGFVTATLYSPFLGMLMDRFGPRLVIPFSAIMMSIGMALATQISQPWHLHLTLGVLVGGGTLALSYMGHSLFLPQWFVRRRGLAIGIAYAGVGVGSIILFPWVQSLISHSGWRSACWAMSIVLLVGVLPLNFFFQRRRPEEIGLAPDGVSTSNMAAHARANTDAIVDHQWAATDWTLPTAMRTSRFWWIAGSSFTSLYAWYAVQVHQTKYLNDIGFPSDVAAYALGMVGLTGSVSQVTLGHISDRIGREWGWTISISGFALCYLLLLLMQHHPTSLLLYLMVASQGLLGYGMAAVFGSVPIELFQGKHFATIASVLSVSASFGAAIGPWVTGILYDRMGNYQLAFWICTGMSIASIICMWMAAPRKVRVVAGQVARLQARRARHGQAETALD
jgi:MFS family permease